MLVHTYFGMEGVMSRVDDQISTVSLFFLCKYLCFSFILMSLTIVSYVVCYFFTMRLVFQAWEVAAQVVKDEEDAKQKLCDDLNHLVCF